jgi:S1-C subfamily serine protease
MKRLIQVLFVGGCAFLGGLVANLAPRLTPPAAAQMSVPGAKPGSGTPTAELLALSGRFEVVARQAAPTVVSVDASKPAPPRKSGSGKAQPVEESGSGVLVRFEGYRDVFVITNNHVVSDSPAQQITVSLADGRIVKPDRVWADPESDIALLRVGNRDLPTAVLGDSERVRVGQWVLAVGSPFGLSQTVTHGIISARERGQVSLGGTIRIKEFLQTDAAINPGSSGGPLFDLDGNVIGINTAIASHSGSNSGVAFSIPINLVKRVARELFEKGTVSRGYLGLQMAAVFEANDALRLGLDRAQGALVETVYPNTPAATAGLKASDVVLQVDSVSVRHENHFINLISAMSAGRRIRLQVWRDRRAIWVDAVVGDWSRGQTGLRTGP